MLVGWVQGKPFLSMFTVGVRYVAKAPRSLPQQSRWCAAGRAGMGEILLGPIKLGLQWHVGERLHCIEHEDAFSSLFGLGLPS